MQILKVENLSVKFENHTALTGISFELNKGDTLAILGPNGAGKSVLFRAILGLIPYSGKVEWSLKLKINYVPQKFHIEKDIPLSVWEFMKFKSSSHDEIISALKAVGLADGHDEYHMEEHFLKQRLGWLSGGQLQRVLIAWSILDNPDVLLFDEPTTGIDIGGEETIYHLLRKLNTERKMSMLLISHDLNIVYKYADSVICLNKQMFCYGIPSQALDPLALHKLYGDEMNFYKHEHTDDHKHE
jgi:zinc transport system ATP-binding protein